MVAGAEERSLRQSETMNGLWWWQWCLAVLKANGGSAVAVAVVPCGTIAVIAIKVDSSLAVVAAAVPRGAGTVVAIQDSGYCHSGSSTALQHCHRRCHQG